MHKMIFIFCYKLDYFCDFKERLFQGEYCVMIAIKHAENCYDCTLKTKISGKNTKKNE